MLTEQERYSCAQFENQRSTCVINVESAFQPLIDGPEPDGTRLFEFAANAPATLAERHPRLTVFAISAAVLLAALTAEIECLSGSGYFWR